MNKEQEVMNMRELAGDIAIMMQTKNVDMPTACSALALLLCTISKDMGIPVEGLIDTFTQSAHIAYLIQPETLQ